MGLLGGLGCGTSSSSAGNPNPGSSGLTVGNLALNFGTVVLGNSTTLSDAVTNSSATPITISSATASQADFQLSSPALPLTLSPGQSATFAVGFTPQAAGSPSGSLTLSTSAGQASQVQIAVSGTAVNPGSLSPNPQSLTFGNVVVGKSQLESVTLSNPGGSSVTVSQTSVSSAAFSLSGITLPLTLAPGQSANLTVTFTPQSTGAATANVSFTGSASLTTSSAQAKSSSQNSKSATTTVTASGDGVASGSGSLAANPSSESFGSVQVGSTKTVSETITNSGTGSATLTQATVSGAGFAISGLATPTTLASGQSVTFSVTFAPQVAGNASGNLAISSNASNPTLNVGLTGTTTGAGQLAISPAALSYGSVTVGASKNLSGTIAASGSSVTISGATSNSAEFTLSGLSLPVTLSAGQSANFTVTFAPQASGAASGSISFASNSTNAPNTEALNGTGVAAPQHSVALGWSASSSTVVGYNVYRGTSNGGPYSLINSADANLAYTDGSVQAGQTYFYVVTAVNSQGTESVYSNQAQATVPTP